MSMVWLDFLKNFSLSMIFLFENIIITVIFEPYPILSKFDSTIYSFLRKKNWISIKIV